MAYNLTFEDPTSGDTVLVQSHKDKLADTISIMCGKGFHLTDLTEAE